MNQRGTAPKLADVPASPNVAEAKSEMELMRERLEIERQNVFRAAEGLEPLPIPSSETSTTTYDLMDITESSPMITPNASITMQQPSIINDRADAISIDMSVLDVSQPQPSLPDAPMTRLNGMNGMPVAYFDHGSSTINGKSLQKISLAAEQISTHSGSVVIIGHASPRVETTNPITAQRINLQMASERAEAVMQELTKQGIPATKIKLVAFGDSQSDQANETQDRRVEILMKP